MSERHQNLYNNAVNARDKRVEQPVVIEPKESLSHYMVDQVLSFIPKSKTLENLIDGLNNGKVHRISRR